ncbi:MAG: hypothetical protein ABIY90_19800 [Puia sp.]
MADLTNNTSAGKRTKVNREAGYHYPIFKKQFPTGTWFEVRALALHVQLIEIDVEAYKVK